MVYVLYDAVEARIAGYYSGLQKDGINRCAGQRSRGDHGLRDLLDVFVDGQMSYARVQMQAASRYLPDDTVRGREYIGFSVVELYVSSDLIESEGPWSCQTQVVVDPTRRALAHGFL